MIKIITKPNTMIIMRMSAYIKVHKRMPIFITFQLMQQVCFHIIANLIAFIIKGISDLTIYNDCLIIT